MLPRCPWTPLRAPNRGQRQLSIFCCASNAEGRVLHFYQLVQVYNPIVQWASKTFQADFEISDSIFGAEQCEFAIQAVHRYLQGEFQTAYVEELHHTYFTACKIGLPYFSLLLFLSL